MNVTGDLILQNSILKPVFFLLTYYVPDVLIIYVYMPSSALIILLSLFMLRILIKRLFWWKLFLIGVEGRIDFLGG